MWHKRQTGTYYVTMKPEPTSSSLKPGGNKSYGLLLSFIEVSILYPTLSFCPLSNSNLQMTRNSYLAEMYVCLISAQEDLLFAMLPTFYASPKPRSNALYH